MVKSKFENISARNDTLSDKEVGKKKFLFV